MKKVLALLLALVFALSLAACGDDESDCPSKNKIIEDVSGIQEVISDTDYTWNVIDIEETLAQNQNKSYQTNVKVKLKNSSYYPAYKTLSLKYTYYDKGGWVLSEYNNVSSVFDAIPVTGYDEEKAYSLVNKEHDGQIELDEHITDLNNLQDKFVFNVKNEGLFWDENYTVNMIYNSSKYSGLWDLSSEEVSDVSTNFNDVNCWFYYETWDTDYHDNIFYFLDQFNGSNASIIVVDLAGNGKTVQGYNYQLMPNDTIHTQDYVCYKMECNAYYDDEKKTYSFEGLNLSGYVGMALSKNSLYPDYKNENSVKKVDQISDVVSVPTEVTTWLKNNMTY